MENILKWFNDRLNPVMVKEVRQALNGREFIVSFIFMLLIVLAISGLVLSIEAADVQHRMGGDITIDAKPVFLVVLGCLAFASLLIVPVIAYRSLDQERTERCYDLLIITTCGSGAIVRGKIYSAVIQLVLFFSAATPFLAAIYLIGNIDIAGAIIGLVWLFLAAIFSILVSLFNAAAASRSKRRSTPFVANILLLIFIFIISLGLLSHSIFGDISAFVHDREFWFDNAAIFTIFLTMSFLVYTGISALVIFDAANRSTSVRIALAINWIAATGWLFVYYYDGMIHGAEDLMIYGIAVIAALWIYSLFASSESDKLSRRVANDYPAGFFKRIFAAFLYPGSARGFYFTAFLALLTVGIVILGNIPYYDDYIPVIMLAGYMLGYVGIPLAILRKPSIERYIKPSNRGGIIFAISAAACLLPLIVWAIIVGWAPRSSLGNYLMAVSPTGGFIVYSEIAASMDKFVALVPIILGIVGILINLRSFLKSAFFKYAPEAPPQKSEDAVDAGAMK